MNFCLKVEYRVVVKTHIDVELEKFKIREKVQAIAPGFDLEEKLLHWPVKTSNSPLIIIRDADANPYIVLHRLIFKYYGEQADLISLADEFSDYVLIELVGTRLGEIEYV